MQTQFLYEVNDAGEWRPALVLDSEDDNNKSFWFIGEGGQLTPTDGPIPRGTQSGHFRDRT